MPGRTKICSLALGLTPHDPVCFSLARDAGMALASSATIVISRSALLIATEG
jgi:hypothetical protein